MSGAANAPANEKELRRAPDAAALGEAVERVNRALAAHAGAVRVDSVSADGAVRLRFAGMCTGCMLKPVTLEMVVAPELRRVEGVSSVEAPGARVSASARARLARLPGCLPARADSSDAVTTRQGGRP